MVFPPFKIVLHGSQNRNMLAVVRVGDDPAGSAGLSTGRVVLLGFKRIQTLLFLKTKTKKKKTRGFPMMAQ